MIKPVIFLQTAIVSLTGGLCMAAGYLYAQHRINKHSKGELVVEENGTSTPNLYLRLATPTDLNNVRTAKYVVCKVIKIDSNHAMLKGKPHEGGEA